MILQDNQQKSVDGKEHEINPNFLQILTLTLLIKRIICKRKWNYFKYFLTKKKSIFGTRKYFEKIFKKKSLKWGKLFINLLHFNWTNDSWVILIHINKHCYDLTRSPTWNEKKRKIHPRFAYVLFSRLMEV